MSVMTEELRIIRAQIEHTAPADVLENLDWCIDRLETDDRNTTYLDYSQPPAQPCMTCIHRRHAKPLGHVCMEYIRSGNGGKTVNQLPCGYAYSTFCGGSTYRPTFWVRLMRYITKET